MTGPSSDERRVVGLHSSGGGRWHQGAVDQGRVTFLNLFAATLTFARAALCSDRLMFMVMLLMALMVTLFIDVMTQMVRLLMMLLMLW